jgi:hypothetical protein
MAGPKEIRSASSYIWLVEYNGGPDLLRLGFYAKKEQSMLCFSSLQSSTVGSVHHWRECTMQFGGDKGQIYWLSKKQVVKDLLDYDTR